MLDKLHEACGVFGIHNHPEASNLTYLGLYALQHRGQESVGIAAANGQHVKLSRALGYVADSFSAQAGKERAFLLCVRIAAQKQKGHGEFRTLL